MTREEAKKKLEEVLNFAKVIEAYSEGKTVQHFNKKNESWTDFTYIEFDDQMKHYRIKPEPREFWVKIYDNSVASLYVNNPGIGNAKEIIKVREIL